jgi:cytidylate kinase
VDSGQSVSLSDIRKDVIFRDESDMQRSVGALKIARGAISIDTTAMTINEVVNKLISYIR